MVYEHVEALASYLTECGGTLTVSVEHVNPARHEVLVTAEWVHPTDGKPYLVRVVEGSVVGAVVGLTGALGLEPDGERWAPPASGQPEHNAFLMVARRQADALERIAAALENGVDYLDLADVNGLLNERRGVEDVGLPE